MWDWSPYVPVAERIAKGKKKLKKILKKGDIAQPIEIEGRKIAKNFWGKQWCDHIEEFSEYESRIKRGRAYAKNGSICHLVISKGHVKAYVAGSSLYKVEIKITSLSQESWDSIKSKASKGVGSLLELLKGSFSDDVMKIVTDEQGGLFPEEEEFSCDCDCPDWSYMCKHIAAVFYGIGNRLDEQPDLFFLLRGVDPHELISSEWVEDLPESDNSLPEDNLSELFGIEMDDDDDFEASATEDKVESSVYISGKEITEARVKTRLSVKEFAYELGVTPATIYRWEKKEGYINLNDRSKKKILLFLSKSNIQRS